MEYRHRKGAPWNVKIDCIVPSSTTPDVRQTICGFPLVRHRRSPSITWPPLKDEEEVMVVVASVCYPRMSCNQLFN